MHVDQKAQMAGGIKMEKVKSYDKDKRRTLIEENKKYFQDRHRTHPDNQQPPIIQLQPVESSVEDQSMTRSLNTSKSIEIKVNNIDESKNVFKIVDQQDTYFYDEDSEEKKSGSGSHTSTDEEMYNEDEDKDAPMDLIKVGFLNLDDQLSYELKRYS